MKLQIWLFSILVIFQYNYLSLQFYFISFKTLFGKGSAIGVSDTKKCTTRQHPTRLYTL